MAWDTGSSYPVGLPGSAEMYSPRTTGRTDMTNSYGTPTVLTNPGHNDVVRFRFQYGDIAGVLVPLFTCLEEAEKFRLSRPECAKMGFLGLTFSGMEDIFTKLKTDGVTHVNVNNRPGNYIPVDEVIADFRSLGSR